MSKPIINRLIVHSNPVNYARLGRRLKRHLPAVRDALTRLPIDSGTLGPITAATGRLFSLPQSSIMPTVGSAVRFPSRDDSYALLAEYDISQYDSAPTVANDATELRALLRQFARIPLADVLLSVSRKARSRQPYASALSTLSDLRARFGAIWSFINRAEGSDEPVPFGWAANGMQSDGYIPPVAGTFVSPRGIDVTVYAKKGEAPEQALTRVKAAHGIHRSK